jgi:virulence-associated protein VagC
MQNTAKARVFMSGRSQHVTIPVGFRFRSSEVSIRRDSDGNIVLSEVPNVAEVFSALDAARLPDDFMSDADRDRRPAEDRPALDQLFDEDKKTQ